METAKELESLITCSVCLEIFTKPRVLKCLHTLCYECIQQIRNHGNVACPECRENTFISEIKPDFKTQTLIDLHEKTISITPPQAAGYKLCDVCENSGKVTQFKCLDCDQFMCSDCEWTHNKMALSKDHRMVCIQEVIQSLTAKLEDTRTELVKGQQVIQMHSQGSDTIIRHIQAEKESLLQKVKECEEESIAEIRNHHEKLKRIIDDKAKEIILELENYKVQNKNVENEIEKRVDFLTTAGSSTDVEELTGIVEGVGQSLTEDVQLYKSQLPDLEKTLTMKVVKGNRLLPQHMTRVLVTNDSKGYRKSTALPGKLLNLACHQYNIIQKLTYSWGLTMKLHVIGDLLWSAAYDDGVLVYDRDGHILQKLANKYMKSACGVVHAYNGDIVVACGEHHDLLRFDKKHRYLGRITSGSFSDVHIYKEHIYTLDYDRGMVLVFDFNPDSNKWFCISHWKVQCYSYGHYCDKLMVSEAGIHVSSYNNHCIYILSHDGEMLQRIGTEGSGKSPGTFQGLILCDIDPRGNVLVCDRVSHSIQIYKKDTGQWSMVDVKGKEDIVHPTDIAVDESAEAIWVVTHQREMLKLQVKG